MSRIRSKDTAPELAVRRVLTKMGIRYRLHVNKHPGKPDIVIGRRRLAIFVNGCFWHQHYGCKWQSIPKSNLSYWKPKLSANVKRQENDIKKLGFQGWRCHIIWECQTINIQNLTTMLRKITLRGEDDKR